MWAHTRWSKLLSVVCGEAFTESFKGVSSCGKVSSLESLGIFFIKSNKSSAILNSIQHFFIWNSAKSFFVQLQTFFGLKFEKFKDSVEFSQFILKIPICSGFNATCETFFVSLKLFSVHQNNSFPEKFLLDFVMFNISKALIVELKKALKFTLQASKLF